MTLKILAAGSLRLVWPHLMARFTANSGIETCTDFGPAGLLRQRIEQGERCALFASASQHHAEHLVNRGLASHTFSLATNSLCLTVRTSGIGTQDNWLSLLQRPELRLATSTPVSDPSGDYTWQFFSNLDRDFPGLGTRLGQRALKLVGGERSMPVPAGKLAAQWLLESDRADMFMGYASYAPRLAKITGLRVLAIPAEYNVTAHYAGAICAPEAEQLARFLCSPQARQIFTKQGFEPARID